jgi:hypothetical protein
VDLDLQGLTSNAMMSCFCAFKLTSHRDKLAYDVMVSGIGGLMGVTGQPDQPAKVGVAISDVCAGLYAHGAILGKRRRRRVSKSFYCLFICIFCSCIACKNENGKRTTN